MLLFKTAAGLNPAADPGDTNLPLGTLPKIGIA